MEIQDQGTRHKEQGKGMPTTPGKGGSGKDGGCRPQAASIFETTRKEKGKLKCANP